MDNLQTNVLRNIELAPYLQIATALIGKSRKIGGNQFRHIWATVGILIDHKIIDPVILKAGSLHDLKEDAPTEYHPEQICQIDADGRRVVELIEELSIRDGEAKSEYLLRVMVNGSREAKLIKLADRISNLIDIQLGTFDVVKVQKTISDTENYILPYAKDVNENMYNEMGSLIDSRVKYVKKAIEMIADKVVDCIRDKVSKDRDLLNRLADLQGKNMMETYSLLTSDGIRDRKGIENELMKDLDGFKNLIGNSFEKVLSEISSENILHLTYSSFY